jgi:pyruvate formate lyase activating enzyme
MLLEDTIKNIAIGGITPFTTIDFPGRLAAVLYTQGCPWRCHYCFNVSFQPRELRQGLLTCQELICFLDQRKGFLDAIVFSGGEPTLQTNLLDWMELTKRKGYLIGLHTTGMFPKKLEVILKICDWVGMDIKAPFYDYEKITQRRDSGWRAHESALMILESGVDYEFRTTVHPDLLSDDDVLCVAENLADLGATRYAVQAFKEKGCLNKDLCKHFGLSSMISARLRETIRPMFEHFTVRE